jgi:hypothetical protein
MLRTSSGGSLSGRHRENPSLRGGETSTPGTLYSSSVSSYFLLRYVFMLYSTRTFEDTIDQHHHTISGQYSASPATSGSTAIDPLKSTPKYHKSEV